MNELPSDLLDKALTFAEAAHDGQVRKYHGAPYISHPIRVAEAVRKLGMPDAAIAAALLHDVIEDCGITAQQLAEHFPEQVVKLVVELTNTSKQIVPALNRAERRSLDRERIKSVSREAKIIKVLDRMDNIGDLLGADHEFMALYGSESILLSNVLRVPGDEILEPLTEILTGMAMVAHGWGVLGLRGSALP